MDIRSAVNNMRQDARNCGLIVRLDRGYNGRELASQLKSGSLVFYIDLARVSKSRLGWLQIRIIYGLVRLANRFCETLVVLDHIENAAVEALLDQMETAPRAVISIAFTDQDFNAEGVIDRALMRDGRLDSVQDLRSDASCDYRREPFVATV